MLQLSILHIDDESDDDLGDFGNLENLKVNILKYDSFWSGSLPFRLNGLHATSCYLSLP